MQESESAIDIAVRQDETVDVERPPGVGFACPANLRRHRLRVRLGSPVDGRRIEGSRRWDIGVGWSRLRRVPTPLGYLPLVPRVVGLSSGDATDLLGTQRFHVRTIGEPGGTVMAQRPRPGTAVRTRRRGSLPGVLGTVTLVLEDG